MARFGFLFLALVLSFNFTARKKEIGGAVPTADPNAGEVVLMVSERPSAEAPEANWKDVGGVLEVTYQPADSKIKAYEKSIAFTGMVRVPIAVTTSKVLYRLSEFTVLSANGDKTKPLASLSGKDVDNVIGDTPYGVTVHIVVTQDGKPEPELKISKNYAAPPSAPIQKEFRSIKIGLAIFHLSSTATISLFASKPFVLSCSSIKVLTFSFSKYLLIFYLKHP